MKIIYFRPKKKIINFIRDEEISPCDDCNFGIEENFIRKGDELKEKKKEPPYEFENDDKVEYYDDTKSSIEGNQFMSGTYNNLYKNYHY